MSNYMEAAYGYQKSDDEETCTYCGAVFRVQVPGQKGHEEPEEYHCPECYTEYRTRASNTPRVTLVSPRTDGRTTRNLPDRS